MSAVNSVGVPTPNLKDSTKEISNSNNNNEKSRNKDIINGRYKCLIYKKYIKPVSFIWHYQICSHVLHFSYTTVIDWRYPTYYKDPLQNISNKLLEDKSRHPSSKRAFKEINKSITHNDNTGKTHISISTPLTISRFRNYLYR